MKVSINIRYMLIQGLFWMVICIATGFTSLYLLEEGVSNSQIGIITAVFAIGSAVLQPIFGRICDRSEKISWKSMLLTISSVEIAVCILMLFISGRLLSGIFMGLLILLGNLGMPFVNSLLFYYRSNDEYINFGVARGIGSGSYALLALIIGEIVAVFGTKSIPSAGIIIILCFFLIILSMPYNKDLDNSSNIVTEEKKKTGVSAFIKKYPSFFVMLVGFIFLASTHNISITYLLQIIQNVGGNSENLGVSMAISAFLEIPVLFLFGVIYKKITAEKLMVFAAFGYVIKAVCYFLAGSVTALYFVGITQIISFAIFASASVYYTGEVIHEEDRTTGQSLMTSIIAIGMVLGNFLGGLVLDLLGVRKMLLMNVLIGLIGLVIVLLSQIIKKNISKENVMEDNNRN